MDTSKQDFLREVLRNLSFHYHPKTDHFVVGCAGLFKASIQYTYRIDLARRQVGADFRAVRVIARMTHMRELTRNEKQLIEFAVRLMAFLQAFITKRYTFSGFEYAFRDEQTRERRIKTISTDQQINSAVSDMIVADIPADRVIKTHIASMRKLFLYNFTGGEPALLMHWFSSTMALLAEYGLTALPISETEARLTRTQAHAKGLVPLMSLEMMEHAGAYKFMARNIAMNEMRA